MLHPECSDPMPTPPSTVASLKAPTRQEVLRALKTFKPGSAAGIDPLTPELLTELVDAPTSQVVDGLLLLVRKLCDGWQTDGARHIFFGAHGCTDKERGWLQANRGRPHTPETRRKGGSSKTTRGHTAVHGRTRPVRCGRASRV